MKKLDKRSHWENEWADAFNDAKHSPSERVWQNIDSVLANKEAKKYKKRAIFYKWLAAASVFISACGAVLFMLSNPQSQSSPNIAETSVPQQQQQQQQQAAPAGNSGANAAITEVAREEDSGLSVNAGPAKAKEETVSEKVNPAEYASGTAAGAVTAKRNATEHGTVKDMDTAGSIAAGGNIAARSGKAVKETAEGSLATTSGGEKTPASETQENKESGSAKSFAYSDEGNGEKGAEEKNAPVAGISGGMNSLSEVPAKHENTANPAGLALRKGEKKGLMKEENEQPFVSIYVSKVWMPSDLLKNKPEEDPERFWVGASVASNSFKPNFEDNSPAPVMLAQNSLKPDVTSRLSAVSLDSWDKSQESIISFAGGFQGAARLGKKWVLQGGLQYGTYKTSGNAGTYSDASGTHTYPLHYANYSMDKVNEPEKDGAFSQRVTMSSAPVSAINTFEFLSVPVTFGYILLDKKVGVVLSPGITSEFFLSNQLTDVKEEMAEYSVSGSEAPYNIIHFRGLVGASVFYKLGDNYVVSIEPSYQHAVTDFNKSGSLFDSRPSNLSLGAAFKYIIR